MTNDWRDRFRERFVYAGDGTYHIDYPVLDENDERNGVCRGYAVPTEFEAFIEAERKAVAEDVLFRATLYEIGSESWADEIRSIKRDYGL